MRIINTATSSELGDVSGSPGKIYLFFLTVVTPWNFELIGDRVSRLEELDTYVRSGALSMILEKPRERFILAPSRTHNRSRSPLVSYICYL